ncbi:hypothetical protein [Sodalis sp.]|uniref:hypothetical protein n=1 Tax=Sodalis sp. (in: enterobacteria) TaxID=1898979 RepID=UPI003873120A
MQRRLRHMHRYRAGQRGRGRIGNIVLTKEQEFVGGTLVAGLDASAVRNYSAWVDQSHQFNFYDGSGIDIAFLSAAEIDARKLIGIGEFLSISVKTQIVFGDTFTAGGMHVACDEARLRIVQEGAHQKFVAALQQISYRGSYQPTKTGQYLFVTEHAVYGWSTVHWN